MTKQKDDIVKQAQSNRPHYHAFLPRVFPYKYRTTSDSILYLAVRLSEKMSEDFQSLEPVPELYHAVTGHPAYRDQTLDLWLSKGAARWLAEQDLIQSEELEESIQ
jgi:hypothetical protein